MLESVAGVRIRPVVHIDWLPQGISLSSIVAVVTAIDRDIA